MNHCIASELIKSEVHQAFPHTGEQKHCICSSITLHACARIKVISCVIVVIVVVDTKIAMSGDLGT